MDNEKLNDRRWVFSLRRLLFIVAGCAVIAASLRGCGVFLSSDRYRLTTLYVDRSRSIKVSAEIFWEYKRTVFYQIFENGSPLCAESILGFTSESPRTLDFELLVTPNKDFVAIVERANPDVVLMFYDFNSHTNYPYDILNIPFDELDEFDDRYRRMNLLLKQLHASYPQRKLLLSDEADLRRPLRIQ